MNSTQTLTITALSNVVGGTAVINGANIEFTPTANFNGAASFDYTVRDNGQTNGVNDFKTDIGSVSFTVTAVNDAPAGTDKSVSAPKNGSYTFTLADFGFSDTNDSAPNAFLAVKITTLSLPNGATLKDNGANVSAGQFVLASHIAAGQLVFEPKTGDKNNSTYASFTFQVRDNGGTPGVDLDPSPNVMTMGVGAPAGIAGEPINLALFDQSADQVGPTMLSIKGVPAGWTLSEGTLTSDGVWSVSTNNLAGLTITSPDSYAGALILDVTQNWVNADGSSGTAFIRDNVEVYSKGSPIFAWSGDDHLTGSSGDDMFVFSQPIGADVVHNFDAAHDKIDLIGYAGFTSFADVQAHLANDADGNAMLTLADGQSITFAGVDAGSLTADDFVFDLTPVTNNAGNMVDQRRRVPAAERHRQQHRHDRAELDRQRDAAATHPIRRHARGRRSDHPVRQRRQRDLRHAGQT